jgi:hypothetical protein
MKIAVLIPTLNSARHLAESILSIKDGSTPCDIWILDGGSEDGTQALALSLGCRVDSGPGEHPAFRIDDWLAWEATSVHGYTHVAIQHSDDIALPDRLALQLAAFERNPELGCVGGAMKPFWHEPAKGIFQGQGPVCAPLHHNEILAQLPFWWVMPAPALMFNVAKLRATGVPFHNEFAFCNDWLHTWQLFKAGLRFGNVREQVLCYRRHPHSDGPMHRDQVNRETVDCRLAILHDMGFDTTGYQVIHESLHLEGGDLWQGTDEQKLKAGDWLISLIRQNANLRQIPTAEFEQLIHLIWHQLYP